MLVEDVKIYKLIRALETQDVKELKLLLETYPHYSNSVIPFGFHMGIPVLNWLIQMQEPELVKLALNNMTKEEFNNILHIQSGTLKVRSEVDLPLMQAIELGNIEIVKALIEKDPTALNKRQRSGAYMGATPLILAANLGNDQLVELLVEYGADIHFPHIAGMTAYSLAKTKGHQRIVDFLEAHGATPIIAQDNLLNQFATWLELKASSTESDAVNDVQYDKELIEKLAKDLRENGHCSGFSWMHRIMMEKKQADLFTTYMQKIGGWDKTAESLINDPFLDSCFNELLQVTIYAQQGESLDLITKNGESHSTSELLTVNQSSAEIARMISSNKSDSYFSNYVQLDDDQSVTTRSSADIKKYIDKCYEMNASSYTGSRVHAIDIGKTFQNGQEVYWIYNSNYDCGTMYFTSYDEFFLSLQCSLLTVRTIARFTAELAADTLPIELSSYMPPLEYRYDVSRENSKQPDQSIEDFLQQKMSTDFYSLIELDDETLDGIYIEFKNNTFHFNKNKYKTLPELLQAITALCGENINDKILGAYDIKKIPPSLPEEVMIKMFVGAIHVNDVDLALRLKALISEEANLDKMLETLAVYAAKTGDTKTMKAVLSMKPELSHLEITSGDGKGESLISLAVQSGNTSCVDEILHYDPNLIKFMAIDGYYKGHNLLTIAIKKMSGSTEMIEYLINKDPNLTNHSITMGMDIGFGPLHIAIKERTDRVKTLLQCAPHTINEVIQIGYRKGNSALMYAVQSEKEDIIKLLLAYGADPNYTNNGKSAIDIAKIKPLRIQQLLGSRPASVLYQSTQTISATSEPSSSTPIPATSSAPASTAISSETSTSQLKKPKN